MCMWDGGCSEPATDVHHIVPLNQGGLDVESNYLSLCHVHHSQITARQSSGWGRP
jgi:hypothetical protein